MNNIDPCRYFVYSMCWISLSRSISSTAILKFSNSTQLQMHQNFLNKKWISFLLRPATFNTLVLSQPDANPIIMSMKVFPSYATLLIHLILLFFSSNKFRGIEIYTVIIISDFIMLLTRCFNYCKWVTTSPPINNDYTTFLVTI